MLAARWSFVCLLALTSLSGCPEGAEGDIDGDPVLPTVDMDGDGWAASMDCDDADPTVHPYADEGCNGLDDDCDGFPADEETDIDGDGFRPCSGDCEFTFFHINLNFIH